MLAEVPEPPNDKEDVRGHSGVQSIVCRMSTSHLNSVFRMSFSTGR